MSVQPEHRGGEGFAAALESIQKLDPQPSFIITGGDHVMDVCTVGRARAKQQLDLYERILRQNTKLPVYPVLGNHDIWGWAPQAGVEQTEPGYGKAMAMDYLGMKQRFYSFNAGGWRFVVLDSVSRRDDGYVALLDDEQREWLRAEMGRIGTSQPTCIVSHIPILSVCVYFDGDDRLVGNSWNVPDQWMHRDAWSITRIIEPYRVPLLLSGHMHLVDRVEYLGNTYICDGAVCGNFWRGRRQQFKEGYGVIDIYNDGAFQHTYVDYGWRA
jgi:3',5'-cyclic AMP phosphodiesterase CpdA